MFMSGISHGIKNTGGGGGGGSVSGISDVPGLKTALNTKQDTSASFSGVYGDLSGKPSLFSGGYADLSGKPILFSGSYTDLSNKPSLFSGNYSDLSGKPSLFSGSYGDLSGLPSLFSGDYANLSNKPVVYSYFPIWAEENADIANGTHEWAFGNGGNTISGMGVVMSFDCELVGLGLCTKGTASVEVEVIKNTGSTGNSVAISNGTKAHSEFESTPIAFVAGDAVNFKTVIGSATSDAAIITAWFRRKVL